jgi:hypothetical protein
MAYGDFASSSGTVGDQVTSGTRMSTLFEPAAVEQMKQRIGRLRPDSERRWGTMTPAQAAAHLSASLEMAVGDVNPPRSLPGRIFGGWVKSMALRDDKPFGRNSPTAKELLVKDERDFEAERARLVGLIERFYIGGPAACTKHPHTFFGRMTSDEWAKLMYKHLDHHLQQFGV